MMGLPFARRGYAARLDPDGRAPRPILAERPGTVWYSTGVISSKIDERLPTSRSSPTSWDRRCDGLCRSRLIEECVALAGNLGRPVASTIQAAEILGVLR